MQNLLNNPVYNALISGDASLSYGTENVKFFNEAVSPFAGFPEGYDKGFDDLYQILPINRNILYATPTPIDEPAGWQLLVHIQGAQFVFENSSYSEQPSIQPVLLGEKHIEEMVRLATLTKPGPFGLRTIDFGNYFGIFENGELAAMTGQRLHVSNFTEISAVCTHPNYLGKSYATALLQHQLKLISLQGKIPFLHVRADNSRAIAVYERLGFRLRGAMNFYFLKSRRKV